MPVFWRWRRPLLPSNGQRLTRKLNLKQVLIEINSLPGLTEATVFYTQVLDAFGWSPPTVLDHLLTLGVERAAAARG